MTPRRLPPRSWLRRGQQRVGGGFRRDDRRRIAILVGIAVTVRALLTRRSEQQSDARRAVSQPHAPQRRFERANSDLRQVARTVLIWLALMVAVAWGAAYVVSLAEGRDKAPPVPSLPMPRCW
jgi:hypothetical protein